ncbi:MAG: tetratricopeptide repeat protein, partial [Thermoplasmata archaeon]|nr:tetratricopeptide repeat protein [Thermoplasmata archaeon]
FIESRNLSAAESDLIKIRSECESLGYLSQLVYTLSGFVALFADTGRWAEMDAYAVETIETARRLGNDLVVGHTLAVQCNGKLQQGEFASAVEIGTRSVEVLQRLPLSESLLFAHGALADAYAEWGKLSEGKSHYEEAMQLADRLGLTAWKATLASEVGRKFAEAALPDPTLTPVFGGGPGRTEGGGHADPPP